MTNMLKVNAVPHALSIKIRSYFALNYQYLLRAISLFIGVFRCNLSTARPCPGAQCRPVPLPNPHAEALLTR